jgi:hypothetical protein
MIYSELINRVMEVELLKIYAFRVYCSLCALFRQRYEKDTFSTNLIAEFELRERS